MHTKILSNIEIHHFQFELTEHQKCSEILKRDHERIKNSNTAKIVTG